MVIYFSASARNILKDINKYRRILTAARTQGAVVVRDWVETALLKEIEAAERGKAFDWIDWNIVREAEGSIEQAEVMIAEASDVSTFGVGYEVSLALQKAKPVLLLVQQDMANQSYATGLRNDLITYKKYDENTLDKIVENFIKDNTIKKKDLRFNFVIDRQIHNHLRWRSYKSGKTKAEVVRDLLIKDMDTKD